MNLSEIDWNFNAAGNWPKAIKITTGALVFLITMGFGYYQFTSEKVAQLNIEKEQVTSVLDKYQYVWRLANNLELHQKQYRKIQELLVEAIKLMPTQMEVVSLLSDISQTALLNRLEFELLKPADKIDKGDMIELPIDIKVMGQYSDLGLFINDLAKLPRIVTIKNINISSSDKPLLAMNALITTYREGISQIQKEPIVLDNSDLVCLEHDGLVIIGCKKKSTVVIPYAELEQRLKEKRKMTHSIKIKTIESVPVVDSFKFDPIGLRDPFKLIATGLEVAVAKQALAENGIQPDFNRDKEALESYSLDAVRMVGTMEIKHKLWGLIIVSDGTIHRVSQGQYLGKNHGRIMSISQDKIKIIEIVPDQPSGWRENTILVALSE